MSTRPPIVMTRSLKYLEKAYFVIMYQAPVPHEKLYVQFMVSLRCKMKVAEELKKMGIGFYTIDLGVIEIHEKLEESQRLLLKENLLKSGLVLIEDKRSILIERIKTTIIELIHNSDEPLKINFSDFLAEKLQHDYTYLSNIFSETKGITIQQFIIVHKIEKIKELLLYDELSISEIAFKMHYSSTAHLSTQFKKNTGLTLTYYKQLKLRRTVNLENL